MTKLRIYLDTSVVNFLFADDSPDFQKATVEFFEKYASDYDLFISAIVPLEIEQTRDAVHRQKLLAVLQQYPISMLPDELMNEVEELADVYLAKGVIPASKREDALHVAYATVHEMDILLSWNFKHLANVRREGLIMAVNQTEGYCHPLRLLSPLQVEDENRN